MLAKMRTSQSGKLCYASARARKCVAGAHFISEKEIGLEEQEKEGIEHAIVTAKHIILYAIYSAGKISG